MKAVRTARTYDRRAWALAMAALLVGGQAARARPKAAAAWDASDERSDRRFDHGDWQQILDAYLLVRESEANRFDYAALGASERDRDRLESYLRALQAADPRKYSRAEQKAYWINFYNALTVRIVTDAYPAESIRKISRGWLSRRFLRGPWDDAHARVAGMEMTLNDIEHRILRPIWRDARIHYALNCASHGCPSLLPTAFTAANTEELLESGARAFVNSPRGVRFAGDGRLLLSSVYSWFREDFGDSREGVIRHLVRYADGPLADRLRAFDGSVDYEYDWSLNDP